MIYVFAIYPSFLINYLPYIRKQRDVNSLLPAMHNTHGIEIIKQGRVHRRYLGYKRMFGHTPYDSGARNY